MGYEKPSTKLTFYKAFFSSQWKFLIHIILQSMSAKRTLWNEFNSTMASAVICLSTGRKFNFSKYIFDSLVRNVNSNSKFYMYPRFTQLIIHNQLGDLSTHTTKYISPALTQKVFANMRRVGKGCSGVETPLFTGMLVAREPEEQDDKDEQAQAQPQGPDFPMSLLQEAQDACAALTRRVKHLEHDKVAQDLEITKLKTRVKKLERANKRRMIDELDRDEGVALMGKKEEEKKAEEVKVIVGDAQVEGSMQEDEPEVQEAVDVVTTAKQITEVIAAVSESVSAASATIVVVPAATITAALVKVITASTDEEDEWLSRIQKRNQLQKLLLKPSPRKRVKAKFNLNMEFLLKSKEQMKEEENRAIESINETPAQKAAKRRKMNEDVKDLKQHLEIVPDEDDDVYIQRLLHLLGRAMFERPDGQDQVWKSQRSVHGQARVKSWKLLESCGVHIITFTITQMILLVERRYPLSRFTLDQMLNTVRLQVEEQSEMSLELLRFTRQQLQEGQHE
nr:hypothetical protein [Tanacetum cinerariifolium]